MKTKQIDKTATITDINLVGLHCNISRAYEIARTGGYTISFAYYSDKEDRERNINPKDIKYFIDFFNIPNLVCEEGDLIVEFLRPRWDDIKSCMTRKYETLEDIEIRIRQSLQFKKPSFDTISEGSLSLLGMAYERLNLSLIDVQIIKEVSCTIAQMAFSDTVKVEHIAEAIQYRALLDEPQVKIYGL